MFVGVIYLVLLNLLREECFKWENVIFVGVILDMEIMLKSINFFVKLLVDEMKVLWKGIRLYFSISIIFLFFWGVILLVVFDILVVRKLCGLKGYFIEWVCFKCFKFFFGLVKLGRDFLEFVW